MNNIYDSMNYYRQKNNYYTIDELMNKIGINNTIIDPFSTLISKELCIGQGNVFYPAVRIDVSADSSVIIGNNNIFSNNTVVFCENHSKIIIGDSNFFGDGQICIKCNMSNSTISFSNNGRYDGRINIYGSCKFGNGSQIIGTINVYNCCLIGGEDYNESDPWKRAGLIKGFGTAKNLTVNVGMVINGNGFFDQKSMEPQINYHKVKGNN